MKTTTILGLFFTCVSVLSCKNTPDKSEGEKTIKKQPSKTYAEIVIKEGGEWKSNKYVGGNFTSVKELTVPKEHVPHSDFIKYEGPGWENKHVAYRLYLDWRNAIDIFGKKVDTIVLPEVGQEGFGSYHEEASWGLDILKAGNSLGIGGFGRYINDSIAHFRNVKNTHLEVTNEATHSSISITYEGWHTVNDTLDLEADLQTFSNGRFTKVMLTPSKKIEGLATGLVKFDSIELISEKSKNGKWGYIATYGAQTLVNESDKLGMALFYKTGQVAQQLKGNDDHLVVFKPTQETITYYFTAAWEQESNAIKNEKEFKAYLTQQLNSLNTTDKLE